MRLSSLRGACRTLCSGLLIALLSQGSVAAPPGPERAPEADSGYGVVRTFQARDYLAVTANPHATDAAVEMLAAGGSAVDAAIAAQLVLGLVEPQSSGIGGGAFLLHWSSQQRRLRAWDGRETAPAAVVEDLFLHADGKPMGYFESAIGGASVGVPGVLKMLAGAHAEHGRLPWAALFEPAIQLAERGFAISPRLHLLLARVPRVAVNDAIRAYFYTETGEPRAEGSLLVNPAYAASLRMLAEQGAAALYSGPLGDAVAAAVQGDPNRAGGLSRADLADYQAVERDPLCGAYRQYRVCGMPPPSSGGVAVQAILSMLEELDIAVDAPEVDRVHAFAEASRLAFADRDRYIADPDFVSVPVAGLLDSNYLAERAGRIDMGRAMQRAAAGHPPGAEPRIGGASPEMPSTSHLSIVDAEGNAVSMTTSIETAFGSRILVGGFLLNNQLTDFSFLPRDGDGALVANRVQPGKRPRSSMSPVMVFEGQRPVLLIGSPGGSRIIDYVARVLWDVLDGRLDLPQAVAAPHVVQLNHDLELEADHGLEKLAEQLRSRGHRVALRPQTSGIHAIAIAPDGGLLGVADPRREGAAAGY